MKTYLPWQQAQWQQLQQARSHRRIPHALLFSGPEMTGKRRFAEAFAASLLCQSPAPQQRACGQCDACRLMRAGTHSDLGFLEPEEPGKALKIDAVREFIQSESLSSQRGGYKVRIIDPADAMNRAAANALLKTLEEPTPNSLMLLISSQPGRLPATIRSRCQSLNFPLPDRHQALSWLTEQSDNDWPTLLAIAAGAPLKAQTFALQGVMQQRLAMTGQMLDLLEGRADPIALAEQWCKGNTEQQLGWLGSLLMDLARLQLVPSGIELFNPDLQERLVALAQRRSQRQWQIAIEQLIGTGKSITYQLNLQLQWEQLLTTLADVSTQPRGGR